MLGFVLQTEPVSSTILPEVVKVGLGGLVGVIGYWLKQKHEQGKVNKEDLDELQSVVFGLEGMEGVVEVLESHDESIERVNKKVDELRSDIDDNSERVDNVEERLGNLIERCRERGRDGK